MYDFQQAMEAFLENQCQTYANAELVGINRIYPHQVLNFCQAYASDKENMINRLKNEVNYLIRQNHELSRSDTVEADQWQQIDTMPKNRRVLLCSDQGQMYAGEWVINPITGDEQISIGALADGSKGLIFIGTVTHWMPLPEPPESPND